MKIAFADNAGGKFIKDLIEYWGKDHEVKYERGASEYLAQWADVYYVEWIDGNLDYLWKLYNGIDGVSRTPDWDNNKKPKIICRMIDWDIWNAYVPFYSQQYIDFIDQGVVIADHIKDRVLEKAPQWKDKLTIIKPGVNLDKFTVKTEPTDGFQVGMVLGDMWWPKNHMGGLDIFTQLYKRDKRYRLHIRGQHEGGTEYWRVMYEHYIESRGLQDVVTLYPSVEDMNGFYHKLDYLLHPGMKETFCYAVAEAMACGVKPVVNDFYGSHNIWPQDILYQTHDQAVDMLTNLQGFSAGMFTGITKYREYIENTYPNEKMFKEFDKLL